MKTHSTRLFNHVRSTLAATIAVIAMLQGTPASHAQMCNFAATGTSTTLLSVYGQVCAQAPFTWALNADPASPAFSTVVFRGSNYYPDTYDAVYPDYTAGGVSLTISAISAPAGQTQTYLVWSNAQSNVYIDTNGTFSMDIKDNNGNDITAQTTVNYSEFSSGADNASKLGYLTITWPGSSGPCVSPTITSEPGNQNVVVGGTATYTVASSSGGVTYQWYKNGGALTDGDTGTGSGATYSGSLGSTLTILNVGQSDAVASGQGFYCTLNPTSGCPTNSTSAALTVQAAGGTCSQTNSIIGIVNNNNGTFTLTFQGTYQAQYSVVTSTSLTLPTAQWQVLGDSVTTVSNPSGIWTYTTDPGSPSSAQFYQAVAASVCP